MTKAIRTMDALEVALTGVARRLADSGARSVPLPDVVKATGVVCGLAAVLARPVGETLSVIVTIERRGGGGGTWLHSSACGLTKNGRQRIPTWSELVMVKELVHDDRLAVQILPPRAEWVNAAEALHLWERLDGPTLTEGSAVAP